MSISSLLFTSRDAPISNQQKNKVYNDTLLQGIGKKNGALL
jgi:hypothetical protein